MSRIGWELQWMAVDMLVPLIELTSSEYSFAAGSVTDSSISAKSIAAGHAIRSINGLTDHIELVWQERNQGEGRRRFSSDCF